MKHDAFVPASDLTKLWRALIEFNMIEEGDKILIGLSGGKIWAESEEGRFCRFSFTLPCEAPAGEKRKNHK